MAPAKLFVMNTKCWSSCYRQGNFNLIMCVFIWHTCLHWQLITTGHLVNVQICWPQSTLLKIFSFCFRIQGQRPLHSSCIVSGKSFWHKTWILRSQKVAPLFFFYWLRLILPKFHAPLTNATASHKVCVEQMCHPPATTARSTSVADRLIIWASQSRDLLDKTRCKKTATSLKTTHCTAFPVHYISHQSSAHKHKFLSPKYLVIEISAMLMVAREINGCCFTPFICLRKPFNSKAMSWTLARMPDTSMDEMVFNLVFAQTLLFSVTQRESCTCKK